MAITVARRIALLLTAVTLLLVSLMLRGPIEAWSFEHLSPVVYWGSSAFLILLGLGSFVVVYRLWSGSTDVLLVAVVVGVSHIAVYGPDSTGIFPTPLGTMSPLLSATEVVDTTFAVVLVVYNYWAWNRANPRRGRGETRTS